MTTRRRTHGSLLAMALTFAGFCASPGAPAVAGPKGYKCPLDAQTCLNQMAGELKNRGWMGIVYDVNEETGVMKVTSVVAGSPAEAAGFLKGDILVALDGVRFTAENEAKLKEIRKDFVPGRRVDYTVRRVGKEIELTVTLAALPPDVMAQMIGMHMIEHAQPVPADK